MQADIKLGPFHLLHPIGTGGMGVVIRATHVAHDHPVAVKVLTSEKALEDRYAEAFRREVRAVARLNHPNIVRLFDSGIVDPSAAERSEGHLAAGSPYLIMELADSVLTDIRRDHLDWPRIRTIIVHILDALAHSHARDVIHRDLKPANVLFTSGPLGSRLLLSDFGIARATTDPDVDTTRLEVITGTPPYMAPEQITGARRDQGPWTDLYALGCLVYWLVAGHPPFAGPEIDGILRHHLKAPRPPLKPGVDVPEGFERWTHQLLARDPDRRFRRAADAAHALAKISGDAPSRPFVFQGSSGGKKEDTLTVATAPATTRIIYDREAPSTDCPTSAAPNIEALSHNPIPETWRTDHHRPEPVDLVGVGLGVFGLRQIPLVGRELERDRLWTAMRDTVHTGRPHGSIIEGPAGIGKTRLATWLAERAHEVGAVDVLHASHSPISGLSDGLARMFADFLGCTGLTSGQTLARIRSLFEGDTTIDSEQLHRCITIADALCRSTAPETDGADSSLRVHTPEERFANWISLLEVLARRRPLLLVIDDVHWGSDTLQFLRYLLADHQPDNLPLMIAMTARTELLDDHPLARDLLADLGQMPLVDILDLEPLDDNTHRQLITRLLGLEGGVAHDVAERTAGNPLFAVQLVGDWVERQVLEVGPDGFEPKDGVDLPLPDDIHGLLVRRLEKLLGIDVDRAGDALLSLELASTLGRDVNDREWHSVCDTAGVTTPTDLIDDLAGHNLARPDALGWRFVHGALRETLQRIAEARGRLRDHHRHCAQALQSLYDPGEDWLATRVARHLLAAGDDERALSFLRPAIRHYLLTCQLDEAETMCRRLEGARRRLQLSTDDPRTVGGWLERARLHQRRFELDDAEAILKRCEAIARDQSFYHLLAQSLHDLTRVARLRGEIDDGFSRARRALSLYEELGDDFGTAQTLYQLGWIHRWRGELDAALRTATRAERLFAQLGEDHRHASTLGLLGVIHTGLEQLPSAEVYSRRALEYFDRIGDVSGGVDCLNHLGDISRHRGEYDTAEDYYRRALRRIEDTGLDKDLVSRLNLAWTLMADERFDASHDELIHALDLLSAGDRPNYVVFVRTGMLTCAAGRGEWEKFDDHYRFVCKHLDADSLVDDDLARALHWSTELCWNADRRKRARRVASLTIRYWKALGHRDRALSLQSLIQPP